jgi:hypothetical protein
VYIVDDEGAIGISLEHSIDLAVARHSGFLSCNEEWKVHIAVMRSARALVKKRGSNAPLCNVIFLMQEQHISGGLCVFGSVAVIYPMQLSGCGRGSVPHKSGTIDHGGKGR